MHGHCTCGEIRYQLTAPPLFVHCCHCRWCQRETGSAFVINALMIADEVALIRGRPDVIMTPTESGSGQRITRCPTCKVAVWSVYSGAGPKFLFLRTGTLDEPDGYPPDIHIFTESKQPWVILPPSVPVMPQYYDRKAHWSEDSLARRAAVLARQ
ncbi:GFA family protein [Algicella marina]|uniref:Aldehyde-activating protein n=1 Tax=Algicella marina TaxID=2683284 RepID=A0A6P1T209_9RHOB|nr:GFA family protein [Algicella marina]QHQ35693.1 aldehyde-activating protein [Algicella marina]